MKKLFAILIAGILFATSTPTVLAIYGDGLARDDDDMIDGITTGVIVAGGGIAGVKPFGCRV